MSWRKYGGTNKLDKNNNVTVNSIVADTFTIRDAFLSIFKIQGDLTVLGHGVISQSLTVGETANISHLDVSQNATIWNNLYLNKQQNVFLNGSNGMIGLNTITPTATFDISTNLLSALNVKSSNINNRNILARNSHNNGIALIARNNTDTSIQFYSSNPGTIDISNNPNAEIRYTNTSDQLILDTAGDIKLASKVWVTDRDTLGNVHIHNETMVVYDTPNLTNPTFYSDAYENPLIKQGNAMSLISADNNSNTMLNITTPNKLGLQIVGGAYPKDINRSMGILDVYNPISVYNNSFNLDTSAPPAQMIVTGNSLVRAHTTTGFNTFAPKVDAYTVDINGAIHINNGEIALTYKPTNRILCMINNGEYGIAVGGSDITSGTINGSYAGRYYTYYTTNGGESWNQSTGISGSIQGIIPRNFRSLHSINPSIGQIIAIIGCETGYTFISTNGGSSWISLLNQIPASPTISAVYLATSSVMYMGYNEGFTYGIYTLTGSEYTPTSRTDVSIPGFAISDCAGNGQVLIFVGGKRRMSYTLNAVTYLNPTQLYNTSTVISGANYNAVKMFNSTYAVAVGNNVISYTNNAGQSWTDIDLTPQSVILNDVYILSALNAIAVGNNGKIYITYNGSITWNLIDIDTLNASGIGERVANNEHHLTGVYMTDSSTIIISTIPTNTSIISSELFYLHMPNVFDRATNYVMDVSGCVQISGDLHVKDEGAIRTNNSTFNIATTSNAINIGKLGMTFPDNGNVIINNQINVAKGNIISLSIPASLTVGVSGNTLLTNTASSTNTATGALQVRGGLGLNGNMFIGAGGKVTIMNPTNMFIDPSNNPTGLTGESLLLMGGTRIMGNVGVMGALALGNAIPSSSIYTGALRVKGGVGVEGSIYVGGQVFTTGGVLTSTVQNEPYQNKSSTDIVFAGSSAELTGGISALGGVSIKLRLWVGGDIITNGVVNIRNSANSTNTATGALQIYGGAGIGGNINTAGIIRSTNCNISTDTATGALQVCGGIGVSGNVITGGYITTGGQINAVSACISGSLTVGSISTLNNVSISVSTISTNTVTGALVVAGGVGMGGNVNINGLTQIMNTSASTNTITGALQVRGGMGIAGNIIVGGAQTVSGSLSIAGFRSTTDSTIVGTLVASTLNVNSSNMNTLLSGGSTMIGGGTSTTLSGTALVMNAQSISGLAYIRINDVEKALFGNSNTTLTQTNNINMTAGGALQIQSNGVNIVSSGPIQISGTTSLSSATRITNTTASTNTVTGALVVTGGTGIGGDVYVSGITTLSNQVFASSLSLANSMSVGGLTTLKDTDITTQSISTNTLTGALRVAGGVGIGGNLSIGGSITSSGSQTITGSLAVVGGASVTGSLTVAGSQTIAGSLAVVGSASITSSLTVAGSQTIAGSLAVVGSASVTGSLAVTGNNTVGGSIQVIGSQTIAGSLAVVGSASITGSLSVTGNNTVGGSLRVMGSQTIAGSLAVTGSASVTGDNTVGGSLRVMGSQTIAGSLAVAGSQTIGGSLWVIGSQTISGSLEIVGNSASTDTATGALQVIGGVGIGGNLFVGGSISSASGISGGISLSGFNSTANSTIAGSFAVTGSQTIAGSLAVTGSASVTGSLSVTGDNTVGGSLRVMGSQTIAGSLAVTGSASITGSLSVTGANTVGGSLRVMGSQTVAGSLAVTGSQTVGGSLWVMGSQTVAGSLMISGTTTTNNTLSGALQVRGGIGIGENVYVGGGVNTNSLKINNADFNLWAIGRGGAYISGEGRALVHDNITGASPTPANATKPNSQLVINFGSDFGAGTRVDGKLSCTGTFTAGSNILASTSGVNNIIYASGGATNRFETVGGGSSTIISDTGTIFIGTTNASPSAVEIYNAGTNGGIRLNCPGTSSNIELTSKKIQLNANFANSGGLNLYNAGGGITLNSNTDQIYIQAPAGTSGYVNKMVAGSALTILNNARNQLNASGTASGNYNIISASGTDSYNSMTSSGGGSYNSINGVNNYLTTSGATQIEFFNGTQAFSRLVVASAGATVTGNLSVSTNVDANSYNARSDYRIKTNITDMSGQSSLESLRNLKPIEYTLIANPKKTKTCGFIAQEVKQTIPQAVSTTSDFVPSIYEMAFVNENKLTVTLINKTTCTSWKRIKISSESYDVTDIIDEKAFNVNKEISKFNIELIDISGNKLSLRDGVHRYNDTDKIYNGIVKKGVFVYGPEVPDLHSIDNNIIWTVTTRATQELDKQLQEARERIRTIENHIRCQQQIIDKLISDMSSLINQ